MISMKLLIVACVEEDLQKVSQVLTANGIMVFSVVSATGLHDHNNPILDDQWFARNVHYVRSNFLLAFTLENKAENVISRIRQYNETAQPEFPIRGFIIPVEQSTYSQNLISAL